MFTRRNIIAGCALVIAAATLVSASGPFKLRDQYVLGLSSGGFMANQYHVAFSASVSGAAIFAAGPFFCAQGQLTTALETCLNGISPIPLSTLEQVAQQLAASGDIDDLSNLKNSPVWLYHGTSDTTVPAVTNGALYTQYQDFGTNVIYNNATDANHAWISPLGVNSCTQSSTPYTSNCQTDPENDLLTHLLGAAPKASVSTPSGKTETIDQDAIAQKLFSNNAAQYSMDTQGYVYVPTSCAGGAECDIMVVIHGCEQGYATIGMDLIQQSNMNNYADTNNFIVLYPQAIVDSSVNNSEGCWDWWSYTGSAGSSVYVTKSAPQLAIVNAMVESLGFSAEAKIMVASE